MVCAEVTLFHTHTQAEERGNERLANRQSEDQDGAEGAKLKKGEE